MKRTALLAMALLGLMVSCSNGTDTEGMEKIGNVSNAIEITTLTVPDSANSVSVIVKTVLVDNSFKTVVSNDTIKKISLRPIYISNLEAKK